MTDSTSRDDIYREFEAVGGGEPEQASVAVLDEEKYLPELEDTDLTEEQKREMLQALWSIMQAFVDIGFGVNSIHWLFPEMTGESSETGVGLVESEDANCVEEFKSAAADTGAKEEDS